MRHYTSCPIRSARPLVSSGASARAGVITGSAMLRAMLRTHRLPAMSTPLCDGIMVFQRPLAGARWPRSVTTHEACARYTKRRRSAPGYFKKNWRAPSKTSHGATRVDFQGRKALAFREMWHTKTGPALKPAARLPAPTAYGRGMKGRYRWAAEGCASIPRT
jgi:hypothetical protein